MKPGVLISDRYEIIEKVGSGGMADVYKSFSVLKSIEILTGERKNVGKINVEDVVKIAANRVGGKYIQINKKVRATINKGHLEFYLCEK